MRESYWQSAWPLRLLPRSLSRLSVPPGTGSAPDIAPCVRHRRLARLLRRLRLLARAARAAAVARFACVNSLTHAIQFTLSEIHDGGSLVQLAGPDAFR